MLSGLLINGHPPPRCALQPPLTPGERRGRGTADGWSQTKQTGPSLYQEADPVSIWALLQTRKLGLGEAKLPAQGHTAHVSRTRIQTANQRPCWFCYSAKDGTDEKPCSPILLLPLTLLVESPLSRQKGWELQRGVPSANWKDGAGVRAGGIRVNRELALPCRGPAGSSCGSPALLLSKKATDACSWGRAGRGWGICFKPGGWRPEL